MRNQPPQYPGESHPTEASQSVNNVFPDGDVPPGTKSRVFSTSPASCAAAAAPDCLSAVHTIAQLHALFNMVGPNSCIDCRLRAPDTSHCAVTSNEDRFPSRPVKEVPADQLMDQEDDASSPEDGLSRLKADHLYTTMGFLVEALVNADRRYQFGKDNGPNVMVIAKHLEKLATEAFKPDPAKGQSTEAIKKRIVEAMRIKKSKLPASKQLAR